MNVKETRYIIIKKNKTYLYSRRLLDLGGGNFEKNKVYFIVLL